MNRTPRGRVRPNPDELRSEQLRPVASPVDTYARPAMDEVNQAAAKAQYVENVLGTIARPVERMFAEQVQEREATRKREEQLQASLDAHGDYYKWYAEVAPSLSGLAPEKVSETWQAKFTERFGQEEDRLKSFALQELLMRSIGAETNQAVNRAARAAEMQRYDNWSVALAGQIDEAKKNGVSGEGLFSLFDDHFKVGKETGLDAGELNKRFLLLQADMLSGDNRSQWDTSIRDYFKARKLDQTQNPEYNALLDQITSKINTPTTAEREQFQINLGREAEALVASGVSSKTFEQWFDKQVSGGALNMGITDGFRARYLAQIENRNKRLAESSARTAVLSSTVQNFLTTGTFVENRQPYTKADGTMGFVSRAEQEDAILSTGRQMYADNPAGYYREVLTRVRDPNVSAILQSGVRAMTVLNEGDPQKNAQAIMKGFAIYDELIKAGGDPAVNMQVDTKTKELYEDYRSLRNMGYQDAQIAELLRVERSTGATVPNEKLQSVVKEIAATTSWFTLGDNDAVNTAYITTNIRRTAERLASMGGGGDMDAILAEAKRRFETTHTKTKGGKAFLFTGDPEVTRMFGSPQKFAETTERVADYLEELYIKDAKDQGVNAADVQLQMVPHPTIPQAYQVITEAGNPFAPMRYMTLQQILQASQQAEAAKRNEALRKRRNQTNAEPIIAP